MEKTSQLKIIIKLLKSCDPGIHKYINDFSDFFTSNDNNNKSEDLCEKIKMLEKEVIQMNKRILCFKSKLRVEMDINEELAKENDELAKENYELKKQLLSFVEIRRNIR
ncbi:1300_t:CDS:2 [Entrophospora sp. SA101]|nr:1300_t:CDS:2 [Entrophospora sp. SA101]